MGIIIAKDKSTLFIGRQGEKRRNKVLFEFGDIADEFPGGTLTLLHKPPGAEDAYPVQEIEIDYESRTALWTIMDYDTACDGDGECQLIYVQGTVGKSKVWKTTTDRSITVTSASSPQWSTMVNSLLEAYHNLYQAIESFNNLTAEAYESYETKAEIDRTGDHPILRIGIDYHGLSIVDGKLCQTYLKRGKSA